MALEDVVFQFRLQTEYRALASSTAAVGGIAANSSDHIAGWRRLGRAQPATNLYRDDAQERCSHRLTGGRKLFAVPTNVGSRTMPNYSALYNQGQYAWGTACVYSLQRSTIHFLLTWEAAFDSLHFRQKAGGGVLSAAQDADDTHNYAPDAVAGYNVNSIVLEVPITMLTVDGKRR